MSPRMKHEELAAAADVVAATLAPALGAEAEVVVQRDGLIRVYGPDGRAIIAEAVPRPTRPALVEKWLAFKKVARASRAIGVLIVPHLTRSLRETAAAEGINWIDLAGNAVITDPSLLVHVEGRRAPRPTWSGGVDPFAPRSVSVVRQLLA